MARQMALRLHAEDLIVDNFAGGGGASLGLEWALGRAPDIAVNHDPEAIAMHAENHPSTRHLCESVWDVDPVEVTAGRRVAVAWFSPDCTYFSKARGAKPLRGPEKKVRALAWIAIRWAKAVKPRLIFLENVEEFQDWGPVADDGRPCPLRRGLTFRRWKAALENLGYAVELRELRACDYGAPTTRKRLFVIARCDGQPIVWPEPTHGPGRPLPWRVAADCIEWSHACPSIFTRERELAEATQRRIARGVFKYVIDAASPFIVPIDGRRATPTLIQTSWGERPGQAPRVPGLEKPLGTVMAEGAKHAVVAAFLAKHYSERPTGGWPGGADARSPFGTVTARDHHALVTSNILKFNQNSTGGDMRAPLDTVMAGATRFAEVRAFLTKFYSTRAIGSGLGEPVHTITTQDRFGLVTVGADDYAIADIGMRMLAPRELYRAQGFPDTYRIDFSIGAKPLSKTAQVRMCGNSVSPYIAAALVRANVTSAARVREAA